MKPGSRTALIVAPEYDGSFVGMTPGAGIIADELDQLLTEHGGYNVMVCDEIVTRRELKQLIHQLANVEGSVLFYFYGHGEIGKTGKDHYLVTSDGEEYDEGVETSKLVSQLYNASAREVIMFFDCCYSGSANLVDNNTQNFFNQSCSRGGRVIFSASTQMQLAWAQGNQDCQPGGVFSRAVIDGLSGNAARNGVVDAPSIEEYLNGEFESWGQNYKVVHDRDSSSECIITAGFKDHISGNEFAKPIEAERFQASLDDYLAAVAKLPKSHTYRSALPRTAAEVPDVDALFVDPRVTTLSYQDFRTFLKMGNTKTPKSISGSRKPKEFNDTGTELGKTLGVKSLVEDLQAGEGRSKKGTVVFGDPGSGKSTLMRMLAYNCWYYPERIGLERRYLPLLLNLKTLAETEGVCLEDRVLAALTADGHFSLKCRPPEGFFETWPEIVGSDWLILLDGLDEVADKDRTRTIDWMIGLLSEGKEPIIVSSRHDRGHDDTLDVARHCNIFRLMSFDDEQCAELSSRWLGKDSISFQRSLDRINLGSISRTPLLTTIAIKVFSEDGALPTGRSALYSRYIDARLENAKDRRELQDLSVSDAKLVLGGLALQGTLGSSFDVSMKVIRCGCDDLCELTGLSSPRLTEITVGVAKKLASTGEILMKGGRHFVWFHNTFREYLAGHALAIKICDGLVEDNGGSLFENWGREDWQQTLLFCLCELSELENDAELIGYGQKCDAIVERILRKDSMNALVFCGGAVVEGAEISGSLRDEIISSLGKTAIANASNPACRRFYDDLSEGMGNPIELLGKLSSRYESAGRSLIDLMGDGNAEEWSIRSAFSAFKKAGLDIGALHGSVPASSSVWKLIEETQSQQLF